MIVKIKACRRFIHKLNRSRQFLNLAFKKNPNYCPDPLKGYSFIEIINEYINSEE
jgi:hypothetical protein